MSSSSLKAPSSDASNGSNSNRFGIIVLPSGVQVEASLYTWTFEDFSKYLCLTPDGNSIQAHAQPLVEGEEQQYRSYFAAESVKTPKFVRGESVTRPSKWSLHLRIDDDNEEFLSLKLQLDQNFTSNKMFAKFRLSILNAAGKIRHSAVYDDIDEWSDDSARGSSPFISLTQLWNDRKTFLEGDSLRLSLELFIFGGLVQNGVQVSCPFHSRPELVPTIAELLRLLYPPPVRKQIPALFTELWVTKNNADLTLTSSDEKPFLVHKAIICCASPYFTAMFRCGLRECSSKVVKLADMNQRVLGSVLEFIYTGNIANFDWSPIESNPEDPFLIELLKSADKLMLEGMKDVIFQFLWTIISFDNVHTILNLAFTHNASQTFLQKIGIYLAQNYKHVGAEDSKEFKELMMKHPLALGKMIAQNIHVLSK